METIKEIIASNLELLVIILIVGFLIWHKTPDSYNETSARIRYFKPKKNEQNNGKINKYFKAKS